MSFLDVIQEPGFVRVAAILRVPFWSSWWKANHADVPFWSLWRDVELAYKTPDRDELFGAITKLLMEIAEHTERLRYSVDDMDWLVKTLDSADWTTRIALLLAVASAPDQLFSPAELSAVSDTAESTWRKWAASGDVIGAVKKGKQWLLPKSVLIGQGLITAEQAEQIGGINRADVED